MSQNTILFTLFSVVRIVFFETLVFSSIFVFLWNIWDKKILNTWGKFLIVLSKAVVVDGSRPSPPNSVVAGSSSASGCRTPPLPPIREWAPTHHESVSQSASGRDIDSTESLSSGAGVRWPGTWLILMVAPGQANPGGTEDTLDFLSVSSYRLCPWGRRDTLWLTGSFKISFALGRVNLDLELHYINFALGGYTSHYIHCTGESILWFSKCLSYNFYILERI